MNRRELLEKFSPVLGRQSSLLPQAWQDWADQGGPAPQDCPWAGLNLDAPGTFTKILAALAQNETPAGLQQKLRQFKTIFFRHLAGGDLAGVFDFAYVGAALSALADALIAAALVTAQAETMAKFGLPSLGFRPVVMALGKLGSRELNYSSDIDLVYLYQPEPSPPNDLGRLIKFFFNLITKLIAEPTADGFCFRVDLDLRPGGKDSPMAASPGEALTHFLTKGRPWERLAWFRARPAAGDAALGEEFLNDLGPFVFRRHLDYVALEELAALKAMMLAEHSRRPDLAWDVKLGPGGIREVEFLAQSLILIYGGRHAQLRRPNLLESLKALADQNLLTEKSAGALAGAYVFLRMVEHRLQLYALNQTQTIPKDEKQRLNLAQAMGYDSAQAFFEELESRRSLVRGQFKDLLAVVDGPAPGAAQERAEVMPSSGGPLGWVSAALGEDEAKAAAALAGAGFDDPAAVLKDLAYIRAASFLPPSLARYKPRLINLEPSFLTAAAKSALPDKAVSRLTRFLAAIGPRSGYLIMLDENPGLVDLLLLALGTSGFLADLVIRHPGILDAQVTAFGAHALKKKADIEGELKSALRLEEDPEARLGLIRRYRNEEFLRLALADLSALAPWPLISARLSWLAELVVEECLRLAAESVLGQNTPQDQWPLLVGYMGKLGGGELNYLSDLDLIFFVPEGGEAKGIKIAQRLYSYLTLSHSEGPGYLVDARLRPGGGSGLLAVTSAALKKHHETSPLWERQALLKFRPGPGPRSLAAEITGLIDAVRWAGCGGIDPASEINTMFLKLSQERAGQAPQGGFSLKFGPGGLLAAEFVTQYLMLKDPARYRHLPLNSTAACLTAAGPDLAGLKEAYEVLSKISGRLGLLYGRHGDKVFYTYDEVARAGGQAVEELEAARAVVKKCGRDFLGLEG